MNPILIVQIFFFFFNSTGNLIDQFSRKCNLGAPPVRNDRQTAAIASLLKKGVIRNSEVNRLISKDTKRKNRLEIFDFTNTVYQ